MSYFADFTKPIQHSMLFLDCCKHDKRNWTIWDSSELYSWICQKHINFYLNLLIAKLGAYGLDRSSPRLLMDYLNSRKHRTKLGSSYSKWSEIKRGIPQGSILVPLLFNIFINNLFFVIGESYICNFVDNNTLYSCGANLKIVLENLTHDASKLVLVCNQFHEKANPEKFQFMILVKNQTFSKYLYN